MFSGRESLVRTVRRRGTTDERILRAFQLVDRAEFVPPEAQGSAYRDRPVGLPEQQTTSQPSLIAAMIEAAGPGDGDRVLEVGTGYGFQTALLAHLADEVVSVERWPELAQTARANLRRAGITNAEVHVGDGFEGFSAKAPYDAVIVSAAADTVPPALGDQLADGGRLVIPLRRGSSDDVVLLRKAPGRLEEVRTVTPARFVPLVPGAPRGERRGPRGQG